MEGKTYKEFVVVVIGSLFVENAEIVAEAISNNLGLLNLYQYHINLTNIDDIDNYWAHIKNLSYEADGCNLIFIYDNKYSVCVYDDKSREAEIVERNLDKLQKTLQEELDWYTKARKGRKCLRVYGFDASRYELKHKKFFKYWITSYIQDISIKIKKDLNI